MRHGRRAEREHLDFIRREFQQNGIRNGGPAELTIPTRGLSSSMAADLNNWLSAPAIDRDSRTEVDPTPDHRESPVMTTISNFDPIAIGDEIAARSRKSGRRKVTPVSHSRGDR
jgi:hypothetical protein